MNHHVSLSHKCICGVVLLVLFSTGFCAADSSWLPSCAERVVIKGPELQSSWKQIADNGTLSLWGPVVLESLMKHARHLLFRLSVSVDNNGEGCGHFPAAGMNMYVRPNTSDVPVFVMVWTWHEFHFLDAALEKVGPIRRILDIGGNCGMSSLYFASHWPNATIITVEPSIANFHMMTLNLGTKSNVFLERAAISNRNGYVAFVDRGLGHWGFGTEQIDEKKTMLTHALPSMTVDRLLSKYGWDQVDYVKIDVEGAELELCKHLLSGASWGLKVRCATFEMHDRFGGSLANVSAFCHDALTRVAGFQHKGTYGELQMYCRS